jgi:hypothetical protein
MAGGKAGEGAPILPFLLDIPGPFVYCMRCFGTSLCPIRSRPISHLTSTEDIFALLKNLVPPKDEGMISIRPDMTLDVPDNPVLPFLERGRMLPDIRRPSVRVFDTAAQKGYGGKQKITGRELSAGEKSFHQTGEWFPDDTRTSVREYYHRTHGRSDGCQQQRTNGAA